MKKTIFKLMILVVGVSGFQSCRKGDNDPLIALKTRKQRLTGEWKVFEMGTTYKENGEVIYVELVENDSLKTGFSSVTYTNTYNFKKDGTFENTEVEDGDTYVEKGNWAFLGKNKEAGIKNKEYITLNTTNFINPNSSSTYNNFEDGGFVNYEIYRLQDKFMELHYLKTVKDEETGNIEETKTAIILKK
ncbi:MAG: hypothetical protein V4622_06320 [Bacteroidota bacterium]